MSTTEESTAQPAEVPVEETGAETIYPATDALVPATEETPEMAPATDSEAVGADTAPTTDAPAAAPEADAAASSEAAPAATEETPAEAAPATPEKKEGMSLLGMLRKRVTQTSKSGDKKSGKAVAPPAETSAAPAESEAVETTASTPAAPVATELADDKPLESEPIEYKTPGGFFR